MHAPPPRPRKANPPELGGDTGDSSGINGLRKDVESYGIRKRRTNATAQYLAGGSTDGLSHRLYRCANHLNWRWYIEQDHRVLMGAKFCQLHLLCPNCAHRRASRQAAKVHEKLAHLAPQFDYWFVTLTVKNGPGLAERFRHLLDSFKAMRRLARDHRKGKGRFVELARAEGLVWAFEFTHRDTGWHPHIHMVMALPKGSAPVYWGSHPVTGVSSQLRTDWLAVTGDSSIVHATPLDMANPHKSVCELVKYSLKFSDLQIPDTVQAYRLLRGRKLFECSGALRGVVLPPDDDLLDAASELEGAYHDFLFRWHGDGYTLTDGPFQAAENLLESLRGTNGDTHHGSHHAVGVAEGQHHAGRLRPVEAPG